MTKPKSLSKKTGAMLVGILAVAILLINNMTQALELWGIQVPNSYVNWIALICLAGSTLYFAFIKM